MSWLATIPLLLFAVVLAFGPGYAMGWALRVPARLRVFLSPLLSFALVAVSAIVLGKIGDRVEPDFLRGGRGRVGGYGSGPDVASGSPLARSDLRRVAG